MSRTRKKNYVILFLLLVASFAMAKDEVDLGNAALDKGDFQTAAGHYLKALKEKKTFKAYLGLANAQARLNQWSDAAKAYIAAVEMTEKPSAELLTNLGTAEYMAGRFENALSVFQRVYAIRQDQQTRIWLARCFIKTSQWTRAQDILLKFLSAKPDDTGALELLAFLFTQTGRTEQAVSIHKQLVKAHPGKIKYLLALANAHTSAEQYDQAIDTLEFASRITVEPSAKATGLLADLYVSRNMYCQAASCYQKLIHGSDSESAEDYFRLGYAYYKTGEFHSAAQAFEKVMKIDPSNSKAPLYLGSIAAESGKTQTARRYYLEAIKENKSSIEPLLYLAELEFNNENYNDAADRYAKAISLGRRSVSVHYNHVLSLMKSGQYCRARTAIKDALSKYPENEKLNNLLTRLINDTVADAGK